MNDKKTQYELYSVKAHAINDIALSIGQAKIVIIITIVSIVMALATAYSLILLFADDNFPIVFVLKMATFIPIIIAPVLAWPLVGSHLKLISIEKELYFSATYDMLTSFLSRNAFFSNLQVVYDLSLRNKVTFSIASIDIDNFKKINDTYGHAAGDAVLKAFGQLVKNAVRKSDFVGRIGGDEFALVLPYTGINEAMKVAENIRTQAANMHVQFGGQYIQFTLSIGIFESDSITPVTFEEILSNSDSALYQAKNSGRNCIIAKQIPLDA